MSKFWGTDSEEEEEEEDFFSDSESEEDEDTSNRAGKWVTGATGYDSDSDDEKREVRAKTDRVYDSLREKIDSIRSSMENNDWNAITKDYDELNKIHQKWLNAWNRNTKNPEPNYIAFLVELEEFHSKYYSDNKYKKGLSKTNKKSINGMQQKMRRNNNTYTSKMKEYIARRKLVVDGKLDENDLIKDVTKEKELIIDEKEDDKEIEWTPKLIDERITEIISSRGKKGFDRKSQIEGLKELLNTNVQTIFQTVQIYLHIISIQFDAASMASHIGTKVWKSCIVDICKIIEIVENNPSVLTEKSSNENTQTIDIKSRVFHFYKRLEQEYFKSLQDCDPYKIPSYVKRMRDVSLLINLTNKIIELYTKWDKQESVVKATLIKMKYQHQTIRLSENKGNNYELSDSICEGMATTTEDEIEKLAKFCFKFGDERQKTHAMLYFITFLANHDKYSKARNLMLMSHIQDSVSNADIETQILFNRCMAYLGICAFRAGFIIDCHNCLVELYSNMKFKELLAQGTTRYSSDKGAEQEKIESRRQMPYHMHINTEILETLYFISAILLEVPHAASNSFDVKRKPISRILKKYLEGSERQIFSGPPEAPRDYFVSAAKALIRGNWKKTCDLLFSLSVWKYISDSEHLITMITQKIKEEGLRTYLFTSSSNYDCLNSKHLASLFELDYSLVKTIISKMIINNELIASWDEESNCIIMHKGQPSRLQNLSLQYTEKLTSLVENNERLYDNKNHSNRNDSRNDNQRGKYRNNQRHHHHNNKDGNSKHQYQQRSNRSQTEQNTN